MSNRHSLRYVIPNLVMHCFLFIVITVYTEEDWKYIYAIN